MKVLGHHHSVYSHFFYVISMKRFETLLRLLFVNAPLGFIFLHTYSKSRIWFYKYKLTKYLTLRVELHIDIYIYFITLSKSILKRIKIQHQYDYNTTSCVLSRPNNN